MLFVDSLESMLLLERKWIYIFGFIIEPIML